MDSFRIHSAVESAYLRIRDFTLQGADMTTRRHFHRLTRLALAVATLVWTMPALMLGQAPTPAAQGAAKPAAPAGPYKISRTPWGEPDFQGVWEGNGGPTQAES